MPESPNRRQFSVVRDPVHGDVYLTSEELRIIDTGEMQRLRGVRQLGTAHLVYPGAQHTRFEHSLGTLHVLARLVDAINRNHALAGGRVARVGEDEARMLRAAALVHDVTHIPFGHSIEDQSGIVARHDSAERFKLALSADTEIGDALDRMGVREHVLSALLAPVEARAAGLPSTPHYWQELLSDTICADILDYLKRDAYYTGLNLYYDDRVVNYFKVDEAGGHLYVDVAKRGLVREDILSELLRVLDARYYFSERVYYHHAKIAAGAMIARAVETSLLDGGLTPRDLFTQTDESLLQVLALHPPADGADAARHRELIDRYRSRRLLKRACVFPLYANRDVQSELVDRFFAPGCHGERRAFEASVADALRQRGIAPPLIVLYCPEPRMQLKEAQTHIHLPDGEEILTMDSLAQHVPRLAELERAYEDLWKLYLFAGTDDRALLATIAGIVRDLLPMARNMYHVGH